MQQQVATVSADMATKRLSNAISRLEEAIINRITKQSLEKEIRQVVVKELDTYINDLEDLILSKQE